MLEHHIQKTIVYKLAFCEGMRFSELKPEDLDNKLFDYHLKALIRDKLVEKNQVGLYKLTTEGQHIGVRALDKQFTASDRAHSVVFLIIRSAKNGQWLLFKRLTHPLLNMVGLMHINPIPSDKILDTAKKELLHQTGLMANFSYVGNGFFKVFREKEVESFIHFVALAATSTKGQLRSNSQKGEYFWQADSTDIQNQILPTALEVIKQFQTGKQFFIDKTFTL